MPEQLPISLQLHTVRDELQRDFEGTLRRVAEIGYTAIEIGGYDPERDETLRRVLAETGLRVDATMVMLDPLEARLEEEVKHCLSLGCSYLVMPWVKPERLQQELPDLAARLNKVGAFAKEHGVTFAYHNHNFEFVQQDGVALLDHLLAATDPDLVKLELDIYWAASAGADPLSYLQRYAGRVPLLHVKDMTADRDFADVGYGTLDIPAILSAAAAGGTQWYVVENDQPQGPSLESAARSLVNLRNYLTNIGSGDQHS